MQKIRIKKIIKEADGDERGLKITQPTQVTQQISFEEDPINYLLIKYPSLKETLNILMSNAFKDYLNGIYVVAPRPTTFKIILHNNQEFFLVWTGKTYICKVDGKKYYLTFLSDKQRATNAIAQLLELGNPIGKPGPSDQEENQPQGPEEEETATEEEGGAEEEGGEEEETLEESIKPKKKIRLLKEGNLNWSELTKMSRYLPRLTKIDDKIAKKEPFTLSNGKQVVLNYKDKKYSSLFKNQKVQDIAKLGSPNKIPFFTDDKGTAYTLLDLQKTKEFGGSGAKSQTTERQERSLIDIINSVKGPKTIVSSNGTKLTKVLSADKVEGRNVRGVEPYSDIKLFLQGKKDPVLVSAKGPSAPTLGSGGIKGITALTAADANPKIKEFVVKFYNDAFKYYKKIVDKNKLQGKNLHRNQLVPDVSRKVPDDILNTILVGTEEMGGPVSYYYIGDMDVKADVDGNTITLLNGNFIPLSTFLKQKKDKIYAHIRKRDGDLFFTAEKQELNGTPIPKIFSVSSKGGQTQSRFGMIDKIRGVEI